MILNMRKISCVLGHCRTFIAIFIIVLTIPLLLLLFLFVLSTFLSGIMSGSAGFCKRKPFRRLFPLFEQILHSGLSLPLNKQC